MDMVMITGLCMIATIIVKLFDKINKEYALFIALITSCFILFLVIAYFSPIISTVEDLFATSGVDNKYFEIIFKSLGVCYLTQFGCDFCKDAGENAIAGQLELAGKIMLLIIALPLFNDLIEIVKEILTL